MGYIYERKINYYETDEMGVVHHSNYIRYFEEARCAWLEEMGIPFKILMDNQIMSPTLAVNCQYKHHASFGDVIEIRIILKEYTGVRLTCGYEITKKETDEIIAIGESKHCFTNQNLRPVSLKKVMPEFDEKLKEKLTTTDETGTEADPYMISK